MMPSTRSSLENHPEDSLCERPQSELPGHLIQHTITTPLLEHPKIPGRSHICERRARIAVAVIDHESQRERLL